MKSLVLVVVLAVVASALTNPAPATTEDQSLILREPRQLEVFGKYGKLIGKLVQDLRAAAKEAADSVGSFTEGLAKIARENRDNIINDISKLRDRVSDAIKRLSERFTTSGSAVRSCIESHRAEAATIFNDTITNTLACSQQRIDEVTSMTSNLKSMAASATDFMNNAVSAMNSCTLDSSNGVLSVTSCLGRVALDTEMKATSFLTQTGLEIASINVAIATLPAALEVCAGSRMVEAGVSTARIVMEVGSCAAKGVFSIFDFSG